MGRRRRRLGEPNLVLCYVSAIQTCVSLLRQGRPAPHRETRQKRREIRLRQQAEQEELELRMRELQVANEAKQLELEKMRKVRRRSAGGGGGVGGVWDSFTGMCL